ncbi:MAG: phosphopantetheine-binding protein [Desulfovibrio sp.]|jgi:acyl carrier protein|nr:phosphopantetheine-binding protein [Desulfovibrio sp.]
MTDAEVLERANAALAKEFELEGDRMRPEADLREDLDLDSLDTVDMVVVLEQEFGIKIGKDPAIASIRTLGDIHIYLLQKKQEIEKNAG